MTAVIVTMLLLTECKKECFKTDQCKLKGVPGPCEALIYGYYYDKEDKKCKEFLWGGCDGVRPFATMEECENSCHCK